MSFLRIALAQWLLAVAVFVAAPLTNAGEIKVGGMVVNSEGTFTFSSQTFETPLNLSAKSRLVVQLAPQYAIDFGIIPAADLRKWRAKQPANFFLRLTGINDTRYITLNPGSYFVVARDLNGGIANNGFAIKVRRFSGQAKDGIAVKPFIKNNVVSGSVLPLNWNGFAFSMPANARMWFQAVFSRGIDRRVTWEIVTEAEYRKFASGQSYKRLLTGTDSKALQFEFMGNPDRYYFLLKNGGGTYSAYTATREIYAR